MPYGGGAFFRKMSKFYYCYGVYLDGNFMEHTCKKRGNCKYYVEDFFRRYGDMLDRFDFLICGDDCKYYAPREPEAEKLSADEVDPFAT